MGTLGDEVSNAFNALAETIATKIAGKITAQLSAKDTENQDANVSMQELATNLQMQGGKSTRRTLKIPVTAKKHKRTRKHT